MKKARALCRGLGNELAASAFLMLALAFDVAPAKAAGYTSLLWLALIFDLAFLDKTWKLMDANGPTAQVVHLTISLLLAYNFLL